MPIRSKNVLLAAAAIAVALPVAGCGSSQPAAKIGAGSGGGVTSPPVSSAPATSATGAPTSTTGHSASATPSTGSSSSAVSDDLPDLTLPSDVILKFNLPKTGDPAKDAALQGLGQVEKAKFKATEHGATSGPIVDDFDIRDANNSMKSFLIFMHGKGVTVTGTNVYYDWKFPEVDPGKKSMQITFCEDENKFFAKYRTTGKTVPQQAGLAQILSFKVDMLLDNDHRWKATYYTWKAGDTECQAAEGH